ncbi:hypothetical protein BTVI_118742 [Pitangus sulphuratus]|nr:hypothetical protein BTVI_118742 [Pitangus sulphuratus]
MVAVVSDACKSSPARAGLQPLPEDELQPRPWHPDTESQNILGWKGSLEISNPRPKQSHLEQVTQERIQVGLECLQRVNHSQFHPPSSGTFDVNCKCEKDKLDPKSIFLLVQKASLSQGDENDTLV